MIEYIFHSNIINFILVLAFFIWLLFFKLDIIGMLAKKSEETINTIKKSENKKEEAIKHLADTKTSLQNVDNDVKEIVQNAKQLAKNLEEKAESKLKDELVNLENRANILKEGYESKAKEEITKKIANAAVAVSKEYIENSLDENTHRELIYNFINDLENMRVE
ncbi:MAG: hypothetical protein MJ180_01365 [Candidatus Gastranaerophilales bacterium]|nr:hypothetical protein [Candidatus Gastranaerophilales bacterium]